MAEERKLPVSPALDKEVYLARLCGEEVTLPAHPVLDVERYLARLCGQDVALPEHPATDEETYYAKLCGEEVTLPAHPVLDVERYLAKLCGQDVALPAHPVTDEERYLAWWCEHGGGGYNVTVTGVSPLVLTQALAAELVSLTQYGAVEQRNIPAAYTEVDGVTTNGTARIDTGVVPDVDDMEFEVRVKAQTGSWYIMQNRDVSGGPTHGISGSTSGQTIMLGWGGVNLVSGISRTAGHVYYVRATAKNGVSTLYVKDETTGTEDTQTGTYSGFFARTTPVYLFGNAVPDYVASGTAVYMARLKKSGVTVFDAVSAAGGSAVGVFDKVSGALLTSATGELTAGAAVTPSPDNPMPLWCNNGELKYGAVGKNLYDVAGDTNGYAIIVDGTLQEAADSCYSALIPVSAGQYTYSGKCASHSGNNKRIHGYLNGVWVQQLDYIAVSVGAPFALTFTVPSGVDAIRISHWSADTQTMVERGSTATAYEPYRAGVYADGTAEVLTVGGKNLFDASAREDDKILTDTGDVSDNAQGFYSAAIPVAPSTTYTLSFTRATDVGIYTRVCEYEGEDTATFISLKVKDTDTSAIKKVYTFTTSENAHFVRFCTKKDVTDCQLERGSTATDYEPYRTPQNASVVNLFAVGDCKDTHEIVGGAVARNVGVLVLDGTEDWKWQRKVDGMFDTPINSVDRASNRTALSTHFKNTSTQPAVGKRNGYCFLTYRSGICIGYAAANGSVPAFQAWLAAQYAAGTPVIVVYPLATPTEESAAPQPLRTGEGTNVVSAEANVDGVELEAVYKASEEGEGA